MGARLTVGQAKMLHWITRGHLLQQWQTEGRDFPCEPRFHAAWLQGECPHCHRSWPVIPASWRVAYSLEEAGLLGRRLGGVTGPAEVTAAGAEALKRFFGGRAGPAYRERWLLGPRPIRRD